MTTRTRRPGCTSRPTTRSRPRPRSSPTRRNGTWMSRRSSRCWSTRRRRSNRWIWSEPSSSRGGPRGDGQTHGPLFLSPENLVVPRAARARGAPRDRRAASAGGLRGRERGDEGEGIREGARAGTTHGGRVHIAHPREAPANVERSGRDPNVRGGRRPRGIDRGPREGPRASRGGRDRAGRRSRDAAQGATGDAAAAGRGGRGRPPEAPGRPRGRGGDEHPAAADERPPGSGRAGVPHGAVRRGSRHRRASGRRRDEGTRPGGRLDHEAVRGGPREGATGRDRHAVLREAVREGPGAVPGEEVSAGHRDRPPERG